MDEIEIAREAIRHVGEGIVDDAMREFPERAGAEDNPRREHTQRMGDADRQAQRQQQPERLRVHQPCRHLAIGPLASDRRSSQLQHPR